MYKIVSYLHNYVKIRITGIRPHKFINICMKRKLAVWDLERVSDKEFVMCMFADEFKKNVRSAASKTGVKVSIIGRYGILYDIRKYKKRKVFAAAVILLTVLFIILNSMTWHIQIDGATPAIRLQTNQFMREIGIKRGSLLSDINTKALAEQILKSNNELCWVGVKKHGMQLIIELETGTFYKAPESIPQNAPCDIVITKDCLIQKVTAESGKCLVEPGNTALKGQIAISGEGGHAEGEVLGYVWYTAETEVKTDIEVLEYTGKTQNVKSLLLFGLKFDFVLPGKSFWKKDEFQLYDRIYSERYFGKDGNLPIGTANLTKRETVLKTVELSEKEAELKAKTDAERALDAAIPDNARILKTSGHFQEKNNSYYYIITAEVLENVGEAKTAAE